MLDYHPLTFPIMPQSVIGFGQEMLEEVGFRQASG